MSSTTNSSTTTTTTHTLPPLSKRDQALFDLIRILEQARDKANELSRLGKFADDDKPGGKFALGAYLDEDIAGAAWVIDRILTDINSECPTAVTQALAVAEGQVWPVVANMRRDGVPVPQDMVSRMYQQLGMTAAPGATC